MNQLQWTRTIQGWLYHTPEGLVLAKVAIATIGGGYDAIELVRESDGATMHYLKHNCYVTADHAKAFLETHMETVLAPIPPTTTKEI